MPPEWADEQGMIESTLRGRIKRSVGDECEIEFVLTNDYGRFRLIESVPDSIYDQCSAEVETMAQRMEMRDPKDPMRDLRSLSDEEGR